MDGFILIGCPGSGKDTVANLLCSGNSQYVHANAGGILREMAESGSELGVMLRDKYWANGNLIPEQQMYDIVKLWLDGVDGRKSIIFNGYPRTTWQARTLWREVNDNKALAPWCKKVIHLNIDFDLAKQRLLSRGRIDDAIDIIDQRFNIYMRESLPILSMAKNYAKIITINADDQPNNIFLNIKKELGV